MAPFKWGNGVLVTAVVCGCWALAPAAATAAPGGSIAGTVTAADTHTGLEGVEVCASRFVEGDEGEGEREEECDETDPAGAYRSKRWKTANTKFSSAGGLPYFGRVPRRIGRRQRWPVHRGGCRTGRRRNDHGHGQCRRQSGGGRRSLRMAAAERRKRTLRPDRKKRQLRDQVRKLGRLPRRIPGDRQLRDPVFRPQAPRARSRRRGGDAGHGSRLVDVRWKSAAR